MSDSERYRRSSVGSSSASTGSWLARMPIEPSAVWVESISTSSLNTSPSGVRTSAGNFECAMGRLLLARLDDFLDLALQKERALGHLVVLALDDLFEAPDRVGDRDVGARRAREFFGHEEGLRQEALDLSRPLHGQLVLVGELVD